MSIHLDNALAERLAAEWLPCEEPWACGKLALDEDRYLDVAEARHWLCNACDLRPKVMQLIQKLQETDASWYKRGAALADACEVADTALMLGNGHPNYQRDARLQIQRALDEWRRA